MYAYTRHTNTGHSNTNRKPTVKNKQINKNISERIQQLGIWIWSCSCSLGAPKKCTAETQDSLCLRLSLP
jgi:hypothetical protein